MLIRVHGEGRVDESLYTEGGNVNFSAEVSRFLENTSVELPYVIPEYKPKKCKSICYSHAYIVTPTETLFPGVVIKVVLYHTMYALEHGESKWNRVKSHQILLVWKIIHSSSLKLLLHTSIPWSTFQKDLFMV